MTKLYLVWNEAKTECVGFNEYESAYYACNQEFPKGANLMCPSYLADKWIDIYGDAQCTITEIEV